MMKNQYKPTALMACTAAALVVLLSACGEKPQTAGTQISDAPAWKGAQPAFTAPGWQASDEASWQAQIKQRNQSQNEYMRMKP